MSFVRILGTTAILVGLLSPVHAQTVAEAGAHFVPNMVTAVSMSIQQTPFYATMLLNAFDFQMRQVAPMTAPQAGAYLKSEILGSGKAAIAVARFNEQLGRQPIEEHRAAAVLLANAVARPDQFQKIVNAFEDVKPGLGRQLAARIESGKQAPGAFSSTLSRLEAYHAQPEHAVYNSRGELESLFDGR